MADQNLEEARKELNLATKAMQEYVKEAKGRDVTQEDKFVKLNEVIDTQVKRIDDVFLKMNAPSIPVEGTKAFDAQRTEMIRKSLREGFAKGWNVPAEYKALGIQPDTAGGYLVSSDMLPEIIKGEVEFSDVRRLARIITTSKTEVKLRKRTTRPGIDRHAENTASSTSTQLAWGMHNIRVKDYISVQPVSNELMDDADFNIEQEVGMDCGFEFGVKEGTDFISGDGVNAPEGILTNAAAGGIAYSDSATSGVFVAADIISWYHAPKTAYAKLGTWGFNRAFMGTIRSKVSDTGEFLWMPGLNGEVSQLLMGRPVVELPDLTGTVTNSAKIGVFGNFRRGYGIVDRKGVTILKDPYSLSTSGTTQFILTKRTGGAVLDESALVVCRIKA